MPWTRIALAVVASGIVSSMTDWLFMGDWLYRFYDKHPEIWRHRGGQGETKAIIWASLLPFLTCSVFVVVCAQLHLSCSIFCTSFSRMRCVFNEVNEKRFRRTVENSVDEFADHAPNHLVLQVRRPVNESTKAFTGLV